MVHFLNSLLPQPPHPSPPPQGGRENETLLRLRACVVGLNGDYVYFFSRRAFVIVLVLVLVLGVRNRFEHEHEHDYEHEASVSARGGPPWWARIIVD